ncbi:MAG TPA: type II toxin-antitoxin system VapC family toxin [Nakamurella sp.]|nr:type II toxin-antitoxin system VapC family toxin [Nakamurella sp.]
MIVLDASILIAHLDASDSHHDRAEVLLANSGNEDLITSVVTLAEVLVGPSRSGIVGRALIALEQLGVTAVAIEPTGALRLALLRTETGLKLPDCCLLLTAEQTDAALASFDLRLAAAARDRGVRVTAG